MSGQVRKMVCLSLLYISLSIPMAEQINKRDSLLTA